MSSAINPTNFELENRQLHQAGSFAAESCQPTTAGNRTTPSRNPATNADVQAINLANRNQDILGMILATFILCCIIASFTCLAGWLLYSLGIELCSWSLEDFFDVIRGYRFN